MSTRNHIRTETATACAACAPCSAGTSGRLLLRLAAAAAALALLFLAARANAAVTVPQAAGDLAAVLDAQLAGRLGIVEGHAEGQTLVVTTPVSLEDLEEASPLARLMAEELSGWFVGMGYRVQEIRRGRHVMFDPDKGELLLSRKVELLSGEQARTTLVLAGTYTATSRHVRFNVRLLHAPTGEVLAMASATLPLSPEVAELAGARTQRESLAPSVGTRLAPRAGTSLLNGGLAAKRGRLWQAVPADTGGTALE